ncbi:hypothetical protein WDU94_003526, partial [Cyamophila willieti]
LRKQVKNKIKTDYQNYIDDVVSKIKVDSKHFWKFYKHKKAVLKKDTLTYNGEEISDPQKIADSFATHFFSAYNHTIPPYLPEPDIQNITSYIHIDEITQKEVENEISNMATNKPAGPDDIPPIFLKKCMKSIVKPLTHIFNTAIQKCKFPTKLKEAVITPVPKKSPTEISTFRPVSNLNAIAKLFEGILYSKLASHVFAIISKNQHGFVTGRSTVTNLVEFCHYTSTAMAEYSQVDVIYTDIQKCFDQIFHSSITNKLKSSGFSFPLVTLLHTYLTNRTNRVIWTDPEGQNKYLSHSFSPPSGIGQGSKLSSLIFILAYDDLKHHITHSQYKLYADDLKLYRTINTTEDCDLLQQDLNNLHHWLNSIGLHFHPDKCAKITFTYKREKIEYTYTIDNPPLKKFHPSKISVSQFPTIYPGRNT